MIIAFFNNLKKSFNFDSSLYFNAEALLVALVLGVCYPSGKYKIFLGTLCLILFFIKKYKKEKSIKLQKVDSLFICLIFFIWFLGAINSGYYVANVGFLKNGLIDVFHRNRYWLIETCLAVSIYLFIKGRPLNFYLKVIVYIATINLGAGFFQLFTLEKAYSLPTPRIHMLSFEPSQAGYLWNIILLCFIINFKKFSSRWDKLLIFFYLILGLTIFSKAQYLVILILFLIIIPRYLLIGITLIFTPLFFIYYEGIKIFLEKQFMFAHLFHVMDAIANNGLYAFGPDFHFAPTYVVRFSCLYVGFNSFLSFPFGIGWGNFHHYYISYTSINNLQWIFNCPELQDVYSGINYLLPRSSLLEYVLSTGVIGLVLLFILVIAIFKLNKTNFNVTYPLYAVLIGSLFVESSFSILYIIFFFAIYVAVNNSFLSFDAVVGRDLVYKLYKKFKSKDAH